MAIATAISWSVGIFPFTVAARKLGVNALNHFRLLLATILLFITSILINSSEFFLLFNENYIYGWFWLGLSGLIGLALGDYFAFKMYAILGAKTGSILTTFAPAASLLFGKVLLDERINIIGVVGIAITIVGVISISLGRSERKKIPLNLHGSLRKGIVLGIMAALCQGAGLVFAKKGFLIQEHLALKLSAVNATFMRMLISILVLVIFSLITGKKNEIIHPLISNKDNGLKYAVAGTFFGPFMGVCLSLVSITLLDVAVAQTIFSLVPVIAMLIAWLVYKQKITLNALTGVLVAIIGVIILIWRNKIMLQF